MDQFADIGNVFFEYAMRGWISNHYGSQFITVLFGFGLQFVHIDVA